MLALEVLWTPAAQGVLFRRVLDGAARPGTVTRLADAAGAPALLAAAATLVDNATPLALLDPVLTEAELRFLDAPHGAPAEAPFLLGDGAAAPGAAFAPRLGTLEAPEDGATLILRVAQLGRGGTALRLRGPGVKGERLLRLDGLHPGWLRRRAAWCARFPLGLDLVLADAEAIAILPRTTRIEETAP